MRLTWKTGMDSHPSMTQTSDGRIWVVWESDRRVAGNSSIFYKIHNQSAVHPWSQDEQLINSSNQDRTPSIIQAENGTIWVVWASNRTGNYDIYYKTYNGSTWSSERPLITDPSNDVTPSIMQTTDGTIWVFWSSNRFDENPEIYYQTSSDGGQNWTLNRLTDNARGDSHPSAIQAANGTVWVVWRHDGEIYYQLYDGGSWLLEDVRLTTDPLLDTDPSITQATDGTIWVVWHSNRNEVEDNVYYKTYTTSWSPDTQLTTDPPDDPSDDYEAATLGTTGGKVWIMWASMRMKSFDLYYRTNTIAPVNDVSIFSVEPSQPVAVQGKNASIEVVAQNKGTTAKTFDVKCYANSIPIGTKSVTVDPGQLSVLQFQWNTTLYPLDTYTMKGEAILTGDTYIPDNTYTDGTITLVKHDVAIKSVTPSETIAQKGYKLQILVVVKNEGNFTENVKVTAYYNLTSLGAQTRTGLVPGGEITLVFDWTPSSYGNYTIKARADPLQDEFDLGDNSKTDGIVVVSIPGDLDGHHTVNLTDLLLINNYVHSGTYDTNIDIQNDGKIDVFDLTILGHNWGKSW